jgi:hypothetical protein
MNVSLPFILKMVMGTQSTNVLGLSSVFHVQVPRAGTGEPSQS